ncbi:uncharacterized protein N7446_010706 [Penicillium canescens]|uniref:Uncharacterized protein n=1 Tax=Penicillium canescens TaxID=5083 RepID=A0AAD6IBE8_PENCN|nr:uncharacterized protein N7446_010706 [Penicillium canescens]KAJ6041405.1 hypothetical protein N7460_006795 [Penicillium canescens]KAJ6050597.1 hypothetical protein N7446_010706 [Penicillium canescens]KAJ6065816.1 hypothetical protein N7444_001469 [Penicillium canescens]
MTQPELNTASFESTLPPRTSPNVAHTSPTFNPTTYTVPGHQRIPQHPHGQEFRPPPPYQNFAQQSYDGSGPGGYHQSQEFASMLGSSGSHITLPPQASMLGSSGSHTTFPLQPSTPFVQQLGAIIVKNVFICHNPI